MRYLLLVFLVPVLLFGCKKKHGDDPVAPNTFTYYTTYDSVISLPQYASKTFSFKVKVISGDISQNHLTCNIMGLPANVTVDPDTMDVAQLLGGVFTFTAQNIAPGNYPMQLVITTKLRGTETHNLTLKVTAPLDYAPLLAGTYDSSYDFCQPGNFYYYQSFVSSIVDTPYLLKISNIKNLGSDFVVRAWVSNIISIPMQTIGTHKIWGSGTYSQDARPGHGGDYILYINDTLVTGLDTQLCTIHTQH